MKTCVGNPLLLTALAAGLASALLPGQLMAQTFRTLHSFAWEVGQAQLNYEGASPACNLVSSGAALYGTAVYGGTNGSGTVFKVNTDGTGFSTLHNFVDSSSDGYNPHIGLVLSGGTLYGVTGAGGPYYNGAVKRNEKKPLHNHFLRRRSAPV